MMNIRKLALASAVIGALLSSPTYSLAQDSGNTHSESAASARYTYAASSVEVIDEIVVVGQRHRVLRSFGRRLSIRPALNGLRRFELQFFPTYEPERARRKSSGTPLGSGFGRTGNIEIFRLSFGR